LSDIEAYHIPFTDGMDHQSGSCLDIGVKKQQKKTKKETKTQMIARFKLWQVQRIIFYFFNDINNEILFFFSKLRKKGYKVVERYPMPCSTSYGI